MDHCQNASEPETAADRLTELPVPTDPADQTVDEGEDSAGSGDAAAEQRSERAFDAWADELRQRHLQSALERLEENGDLGEDQRTAVAACSRALVDEILRCPRWRLRTDGGEFDGQLHALFDIDRE